MIKFTNSVEGRAQVHKVVPSCIVTDQKRPKEYETRLFYERYEKEKGDSNECSNERIPLFFDTEFIIVN